uniref:Uncharacterized protein n=1 Tax=Cannabis sativa TaxID=3483 RepID=A0A803PY14_CANSA
MVQPLITLKLLRPELKSLKNQCISIRASRFASVFTTSYCGNKFCTKLQNLKKGIPSLNDYLLKLKQNFDLLASVGETLSNRDHVAAIFKGLPSEYDTFVISSNTRVEQYSRKFKQQQFGHGNFQSNHGAGQLGNQFGNRSFNRGNDYGFTPGLNSGGRGNSYPNRGGSLEDTNHCTPQAQNLAIGMTMMVRIKFQPAINSNADIPNAAATIVQIDQNDLSDNLAPNFDPCNFATNSWFPDLPSTFDIGETSGANGDDIVNAIANNGNTFSTVPPNDSPTQCDEAGQPNPPTTNIAPPQRVSVTPDPRPFPACSSPVALPLIARCLNAPGKNNCTR